MGSKDQQLALAVVAFAKANIGKKVGDGECFALADKALRNARAKTAENYGEITDDADYVWGDPVDLNDVAPGDILQFRNFDVDTQTETVTNRPDGSTETRTSDREMIRGHHTAVVEKNLGNGNIIILEQNVAPKGKIVQRNTIPISGPNVTHQEGKITYTTITVTVTGSITAYRPHAR